MSAPVRTPRRPIRDLYYVRLATTGLSFLIFGVIGTLLGFVVVPLLMAMPSTRAARQGRVRRMIRLVFRMFTGFMHHSGCMSYSVTGAEHLGRPGQLIVANHPSLIDIVLLLASVPGAGCVVKRAAWRNPSMVIAVSAAGYVPNAPTEQMIEQAATLLSRGESLIMFPEGTRTVPNHPVEFHRGAASVALRAARVVTPVFIHVEPPNLFKSVPWYRIPAMRSHFSLRVGPDIDPAPFRGKPLPLASRAFNQHLVAIYADEAAAH